MTDIVKRLRTYFTDNYRGKPMASDELANEAADLIERLRAGVCCSECEAEWGIDDPMGLCCGCKDKTTERIEELDTENDRLLTALNGYEHWSKGEGHIITTAQIDAAWKWTKRYLESFAIMRELGIERDGDGWRVKK